MSQNIFYVYVDVLSVLFNSSNIDGRHENVIFSHFALYKYLCFISLYLSPLVMKKHLNIALEISDGTIFKIEHKEMF